MIGLGRKCRMFERLGGRVSCNVTYLYRLLQTNPVTHPLPDWSGPSIFFPKLMELTDTQITKRNVTTNILGYQICISKYTCICPRRIFVLKESFSNKKLWETFQFHPRTPDYLITSHIGNTLNFWELQPQAFGKSGQWMDAIALSHLSIVGW